jgi:hypothetical protein
MIIYNFLWRGVPVSRLTISTVSSGRNNFGHYCPASVVVIHVDIVVDFRRIYVILLLMSFVERDPSYCSLTLLCYSNGFILYFRCKGIHDLRQI